MSELVMLGIEDHAILLLLLSIEMLLSNHFRIAQQTISHHAVGRATTGIWGDPQSHVVLVCPWLMAYLRSLQINHVWVCGWACDL